MSGLYGPALPPGFRQRSDRDDDDDVVSSSGVNASSSDVFRETCHVSSHSREADHHVTSAVRPTPTVVRHRADTHSEVSSTGQQRCCITTTRSDHQEMTVSSPSEDENNLYGPANWRVNGRGCAESFGEVSSSTSPVKGCEIIGPCLPPGFGQSQPNDDSSASSSTCVPETRSDPKGQFASRASKSSVQSGDTSSTVGSNEPTSNSMCDVIGPALPPGFLSRPEESEDDNEEDESETDKLLPIGPCLPPRATTSGGMYGPVLPPGFKSSSSDENSHAMDIKLPPSTATEDGDTIGPLTGEMFRKGMADNTLAEDIEKRAANMKDKLEGKLDAGPEVVTRETWMTELPPELGVGFGLTARQFKGNKSTSTGDRSVWTETPADRAKKLKDQAEGRVPKRSHESREEAVISEKDKICTERIAEFNKSKRAESLLDMHAKQRKIAKEQEAIGPKERRPFDRDVDLGIVNLNSAQRKSIIDKSHALNTRFGHGQSTSHFL